MNYSNVVTATRPLPTIADAAERFSLFPHQVAALEVLERRNGIAGLWHVPRAGKTRTVYAFLWKRRVRRTIVLCPSSGTFVWKTEIEKINAKRRTLGYKVLLAIDGTAKDKAEAVRTFGDGVIAVTYANFWRKPLWDAIIAWGPEAVITDECQNIRGRGSKQSKFAGKFPHTSCVHYRIALSGTPQEQGLEDWFGIYRFLDPDVLGSSWTAFCQRYVTFNPFTPFPKIDGYRNEEDLRRRVALTSHTVTEAEARPYQIPTTEEILPVTLTPQSRARYKQFKRDAIMEVTGIVPGGQTVADDGTIVEAATGRPVTGTALARIALTVLLRLEQLTCGFINTDNGLIDVSSEKVEMTVDRAKNAVENNLPTVIFCRWLRDLDRLCPLLGIPRDEAISGSTPIRKRNELISEFQTGKRDLLIGQIKSLSTSIELSRGRVGIFHSFGYKSGEMRQAKARFKGPNQAGAVELDFLVATNTVDERILRALQGKEDLANWMLDPAAVREMLELGE